MVAKYWLPFGTKIPARGGDRRNAKAARKNAKNAGVWLLRGPASCKRLAADSTPPAERALKGYLFCRGSLI